MPLKYFDVSEYTVPAQYIREYPGATRLGKDDGLQLAVKRYTPRTCVEASCGAMTILASGGNGFPKVRSAMTVLVHSTSTKG